MRLNFNFDGYDYDYEVDAKQYIKALRHILGQQSKEMLIEVIISTDMCCIDLSDEFGEELKDYFRDRAYKEFISGRD